MTFQVRIMFGLGFMGFLVAIFNFVGLFNYDRMIGILFMIFLAAILDFRNQIANFRDEKSPLSFITFKYTSVCQIETHLGGSQSTY